MFKEKKSQRRIPLPLIFAAVFVGLYLSRQTRFFDFLFSDGLLASIIGHPNNDGPMPESLVVYDWKDPELGSMKQHMEIVRMDTQVTRRGYKRYFPISEVHQKDMLHTGACAAIVDTNITMQDAKILLLKRGPQLMTCPNTWSIMGEHTYRDEEPKETILRGLKEELGDSVYRWFLKMGGNPKPLLQNPILFHLDYHDDRGRMERQITYTYVIEMNTPLEELQKMMKVDEEVAEVTWMTRQEIQDGWMNSYKPSEKFCHHEMTIFLQLMLHRIEDLGKEANTKR